jgi:hypothetical protein
VFGDTWIAAALTYLLHRWHSKAGCSRGVLKAARLLAHPELSHFNCVLVLIGDRGVRFIKRRTRELFKSPALLDFPGSMSCCGGGG